MKVAIITVNYNGKKDTLEFLESLKKLDISGVDVNIVVVDNGSSDGSAPEIAKRYPHVEVLQTGQNLGFSGGYNFGIKHAQAWGADYFFIINNDTLIKDRDLIKKL